MMMSYAVFIQTFNLVTVLQMAVRGFVIVGILCSELNNSHVEQTCDLNQSINQIFVY